MDNNIQGVFTLDHVSHVTQNYCKYLTVYKTLML